MVELLVVVFDFIALPSVLFASDLTELDIALAFDATELAVLASELAAFAKVLAELETALLTLAAVLASPPQAAIPKALRAKSVESAITFFIIELILLSSSKIKFTYFYSRPRNKRSPVPNPNFLEHWTI